MPTAVHALHDNPEWWPPFAAAFAAEGVPVVEHLLSGDGVLDLDADPPEGVFWSRMSASAHTRGRALAKEQARSLLAWLEASGRRVVNGRAVLELEMSKVAQHAALRASGLDVPRTTAVVGRAGLAEAAARIPMPFVTKHNQGGKGLGVRLVDSAAALEAALADVEAQPPADGIVLLQEYVRPAAPFVTRVEMVGGAYVYSVRVSTEQGFELCPADACAVPGAAAPLFELRKDYVPPQLEGYRTFLRRTGIEIAGIEFVETADGRLVTYDVNTNTNYNPDVEAQAERSGPREVARYLGRLAAQQPSVRQAS